MAFQYPPCTYRVSAKAVILIDGKLLLVKEETEQWELPGGGIEHKEDINEALHREIKEETGLTLSGIYNDKIEPWVTYDYEAKRPLIFLVCLAKSSQKLEHDVYNNVTIGLFDKQDLQTLPLVPYIENFRQQLLEMAFRA